MELFLLMIGGHFLADYVFQTDAIATGKNRHLEKAKFGVNWWYWLTSHAFAHGAFVYLITGNAWLGVAEVVAHWIIDFGKCEQRYGLHTDQALHIGCKALWLVFI